MPVPAEWNLHCTACDYDLTRLTTGRCPECGRRFDPHDIWVANKLKQAGVGRPTPVYVVYGLLSLIVLMLLPLGSGQFWWLLPLAFLPAFEGAAFFLNRQPGFVRPIVAALVITACLLIFLW